MLTIRLLVTQNVLDVVNQGRDEQRQIAVRRPSLEIRGEIAEATAAARFHLRLGEAITLVIGDNSAIWRVHQPDPEDFDSLFELLSRRPGHEMEFVCDRE